jgi:epoxyqueuosine reductase QueG
MIQRPDVQECAKKIDFTVSQKGAAMNSRMFAESLTAFLTKNGVPVFGTSGAEALETEPSGSRPSDCLEGAQSLVSLGIPVPKGVFHAKKGCEALYWRTANIYYRQIDALLLKTAAFLEEHGETAVPVYGCFPYAIRGKGDMVGDLDLVKVGIATGIGVKAKNGLLYHAMYGPRLILGGIITTAKLERTALPECDQKGCPADCFDCRNRCPASAIEKDGKVNGPRCTKHSSVSPLFSHIMKSDKPQPEDLQMLNHVTAVDDHSWYTCITCVAVCPHM